MYWSALESVDTNLVSFFSLSSASLLEYYRTLPADVVAREAAFDNVEDCGSRSAEWFEIVRVCRSRLCALLGLDTAAISTIQLPPKIDDDVIRKWRDDVFIRMVNVNVVILATVVI